MVEEQSCKVLGISPGMNCRTLPVYSQASGALHWEGRGLDSQCTEKLALESRTDLALIYPSGHHAMDNAVDNLFHVLQRNTIFLYCELSEKGKVKVNAYF